MDPIRERSAPGAPRPPALAAVTSRRPSRLPGLFLLALAAAAAAAPGCGSASPVEPSGSKPGGTVTGRYTLTLTPASTCGGRAVTFNVDVTQTASSPHPGVQLLLLTSDPAQLELELKYTDNTLEGGIGTWDDGTASVEGAATWVRAILSGSTTQTSDGRGEVVSGVMRGYLEIEGVIAACTATNHTFALRAAR